MLVSEAVHPLLSSSSSCCSNSVPSRAYRRDESSSRFSPCRPFPQLSGELRFFLDEGRKEPASLDLPRHTSLLLLSFSDTHSLIPPPSPSSPTTTENHLLVTSIDSPTTDHLPPPPLLLILSPSLVPSPSTEPTRSSQPGHPLPLPNHTPTKTNLPGRHPV